MNFAEEPKLYINEYYNEKKNQIDFSCEKEISESNDETEIQSLNELRMDMIEKIDSAKQTVLQRYETIESKYTKEMLRKDTKNIKDETFLDQYCFIFSSYYIPLLQYRLGLLIFCEYDDIKLEYLQYWKYVRPGRVDYDHGFIFLYQYILAALGCHLKQNPSHVILLEKGKWLQSDKMENVLKNFRFKDEYLNHCENIEDFADQIRYLSIKTGNKTQFDERLFKKLTYFTNLVHLDLEFYKMRNLPESLFSNFTKLEELELDLIPHIKLNKNHFHGLQNLHKLTLKYVTLYGELDTFTNLKSLNLKTVDLKEFSFVGLESLELLTINSMEIYSIYNSCSKEKLNFKNLTKLKSLEIYVFDQSLQTLKFDLELRLFFERTFQSIPKNVVHFTTNISFFEYLNSKPMSAPFIYQLKSIEIKRKKYLYSDIFYRSYQIEFEKSCLFQENLFEKLECLTLESHLVGSVKTKELKNLKNLKILKTNNLIFEGAVEEFNYLTEASFSIQMPDNISNFVALQKLSLKQIKKPVPLNETFLESLVNLEELELINVFKSIDVELKYLFKSLTKLKKLTMTRNTIETVKSSFFNYLIDLEELNLSSNCIEFIESGSFKSLLELKSLDLSNNNLTQITKYTFSSNHKLERLSLMDIRRFISIGDDIK